MKQSPWTPILMLIGAAAAVGIMASWGCPDEKDRGARSARSADGAEGARVEDFTLPDLDGRNVRFSEYVSDRPFVVTFGQTHCPGCILQLREFKKVRERFGDRVALLDVNLAEPASRVAEHVKRLESVATTLIDRDASIYERYGSGPIPVTLVGDRQRRILTIDTIISADELIEMLEAALNGNGDTGDAAD